MSKDIQKDIDKYGWHFLFVFDPDGERPDFAYSIGLEESYDHPEIMVFGLDKDTAHEILSDIADDLKTGKKYQLNTKFPDVIAGDFEIMFKEVKQSAYSEYLGTAVDYYEKPFRAWVLFWPDKSNILPTEDGCSLTVQDEGREIVV